jgi:hypothetical protein
VARNPWQPGHSWLERLLGTCLEVLLCALALHVAAELILSVWVVLASTAGAVLILAVAFRWWGDRSSGW